MSHRTLLSVATAVIVAAASTSAQVGPSPPVMPPWPLEGTVDYARSLASASTLSSPTGFQKSDYLALIDGVVQFFRQFQNASGAIIDPYR
jgi:hypothetical protein